MSDCNIKRKHLLSLLSFPFPCEEILSLCHLRNERENEFPKFHSQIGMTLIFDYIFIFVCVLVGLLVHLPVTWSRLKYLNSWTGSIDILYRCSSYEHISMQEPVLDI